MFFLSEIVRYPARGGNAIIQICAPLCGIRFDEKKIPLSGQMMSQNLVILILVIGWLFLEIKDFCFRRGFFIAFLLCVLL